MKNREAENYINKDGGKILGQPQYDMEKSKVTKRAACQTPGTRMSLLKVDQFTCKIFEANPNSLTKPIIIMHLAIGLG